MKRLLLSLLFLSLPAMAAPKYVIQWRDQFGNYRNYQSQHGRTSAYRTAETKARQTGKVYRIVDGDGIWWISSIPDYPSKEGICPPFFVLNPLLQTHQRG